jgi:hypothetical protein
MLQATFPAGFMAPCLPTKAGWGIGDLDPSKSGGGDPALSSGACAGRPLMKISAAERPNFVLGQLAILGVAIFVVTLVELTFWLANWMLGDSEPPHRDIASSAERAVARAKVDRQSLE